MESEALNRQIEAKPTKNQKEDLNEIIRIEDKYWIPEALKHELSRLLMEVLGPDGYTSASEGSWINSTYFESPELDIFKSHFRNPERRFKIRTRCYGSESLAAQSFFLEMKSRFGTISRKFRIAVGPTGYMRLMNGLQLSIDDELRCRNPGADQTSLAQRVEQFNSLIESLGLSPFCKVRYRRKAFESGGVRATLDDQLDHQFLRNLPIFGLRSPEQDQLLALAARCRPNSDLSGTFLLELKHPGQIPHELMEFLRKHRLRKTSFSKYCHSVAGALWE